VAGDFRGLVGRVSELNATGFAAPAGVDLCFDDNNGRAETLRGGARLFLGERNLTAGSRNAVASKDRFGLIFVNLHRVPCSV
jgi:hypothetical protein